MHYAGILVIPHPGALERCLQELRALPGVEVHFDYPERHRIIAVQETDTVRDQEEGLRRIQALDSVVTAALVEHRIDPPADSVSDPESPAEKEPS